MIGTGHSHILAEELFYRAGGLAAINPILVDRLMLHLSAADSTRLERLTATGEDVLSGLTLAPGDAMIVASNSGGNAVCNVVAAGAKRAGVHVIAIVSRAHAAAAQDRGGAPNSLSTVADAIAVETAQLLGDLGAPVGVLASSNVIGGDEHNAAVLAPFRDRVRSL